MSQNNKGKGDYSTVMTIAYFSLYAIIFLVASFVSALSVRKELKQHKMVQNQLEINVHSTPNNGNQQKQDDTDPLDAKTQHDTNRKKDQNTVQTSQINSIQQSNPNQSNNWKWYTPIQKWYKSIQKKRKIYISLLPHIFDQATDFGVIFEYYYIWRLGDDSPVNAQINTLYLWGISIFVLIVHRIISGYAVLRLTHKWIDVFLQMFDLLMVKCVWINYQLDIDEPSNSQRYLQVLEATFESSPQLLISMGYLAKNGVKNASPIIIISTIASLFSLTSRIANDDKAMFSQKMKNSNFHFKSLISLDFFDAINLWYVLRVFLWRLVEMTCRIFLCTLIWINLGGFALFFILTTEFAYITYVSIKLKTIDTMGLMVYMTFATGSYNRKQKKEEMNCPGKHGLYILDEKANDTRKCDSCQDTFGNLECGHLGCVKCEYFLCNECYQRGNESDELQEPLFEFNNMKIYANEMYLMAFGVYRIISSFLYLILVTIFTMTRFDPPLVSDYDTRHNDTIEQDFVLFILIYTWIGSCFWPLSMFVSAVANDGLRSNARDIPKLIQNGYILELMQLIEFGSEYPYDELCDIFTHEQRLVIAHRLVMNADQRTWQTIYTLLQYLGLKESMVNKQFEKMFDDDLVLMIKDIQQSQTIYGGTLLHHAAKYSSFDIVKYLISIKGVDIEILCDDDHSVYYYVKYDRDDDLKDTTEIIELLDNMLVVKPDDYNWKRDQEIGIRERNNKKKEYLSQQKEIEAQLFEKSREKEEENDEKLEKINETREKKIKDIGNEYLSSEEWKQMEKEKLRIESNRQHDKTIKEELEIVKRKIKDITGEERKEQEKKAKDIILHAARQTLPAAPLLICLALLPIAFIIISLIASIMATAFLFDNDVYKLECVQGSELRINSLNIAGYRFECIVLLIFSWVQFCTTIPTLCAIGNAINNGEDNVTLCAIVGTGCNAIFIIVELCIMFHLYHVWDTADCPNTHKVPYSLDTMATIYRLWFVIAIIIIVFVLWLYSYFRRLIVNYIRNEKDLDRTNEAELEMFMYSNISETSIVGPFCCGLCMLLLWVLMTLIVMIMAASMILQFNENCYRFNGSAKIEFAVLFIICCLSLSMPLRIVAHSIVTFREYDEVDDGFVTSLLQRVFQSLLRILTVFSKPKIAEFCVVLFCQIVLMFHSFLYWNDIAASNNDDCDNDTYFTAKDVSDSCIVWIIILVLILLFIYLFIRAINGVRDAMIKQTTDKIENTGDSEYINRGQLWLLHFFHGDDVDDSDITDLTPYHEIEHADISSPNMCCTVTFTYFIVVVWSMFSIIISLVSLLISVNIGGECTAISSWKMLNHLNINNNMVAMITECALLCLLTLVSLRLIYFFIKYVFNNYDYHQQQQIPKTLLHQQKHSKVFINILWFVSVLQSLIMIHLYILFGYIIDCGYYFNFQISKAIIAWFTFGLLMIPFVIRLYKILNKLHIIYIENKENMKNIFNKLKSGKVKGAQDCPGNHGLTQNEIQYDTRCNACFMVQIEGATMYQCHECQYDECAKCYNDEHEIIEEKEETLTAEEEGRRQRRKDETEEKPLNGMDDLDIVLTIHSKIEAYSSIPIFCCFYILWFVSCFAFAVVAIKFLFDDDISSLYTGCNDDLLINGVNINGYRTEAVVLLIMSILPCCIPCAYYCMTEADSENPQIICFGCSCCTFSIQLMIIVHLYFVFGSTDCDPDMISNVSLSPKILSKISSAFISFIVFIILLMTMFYYSARANIFERIDDFKDKHMEQYDVDAFIFKKNSRLSIVLPLVLILILTVVLIILTLIFGCMVLIMSALSSNIVSCGSHDWFGRIIGFCVFAVSLITFISFICIALYQVNTHHHYLSIFFLTEQRSQISTFLSIILLQFILMCHQFIYWNNLNVTTCNPTYVTVNDIRNASLLWLIVLTLILLCFVAVIQQLSFIRNVIIQKRQQEIEEFDEKKIYHFIQYQYASDPPQISSPYLIYVVFISICLFVSWILFTFIICIVGLLISLNKYVLFMKAEKDNMSSIAGVISYLTIEIGALVIISTISCYLAYKQYKLIYYEYDCYHPDKIPAKLLSQHSKLTLGFYILYVLQCLFMFHLAFVFENDIQSETLYKNDVNMLYLIIVWFCNGIILIILYRLILFKWLNKLHSTAIKYQTEMDSKLAPILSEIKNIEDQQTINDEQSEKIDEIEVVDYQQQICTKVLEKILIKEFEQEIDFLIPILDKLIAELNPIYLRTQCIYQQTLAYTVLDLMHLILPNQSEKCMKLISNLSSSFMNDLKLFLVTECEMIKTYFTDVEEKEIVNTICEYYNNMSDIFEYKYAETAYPKSYCNESCCYIKSVSLYSNIISIEYDVKMESLPSSTVLDPPKESHITYLKKTMDVQFDAHFEYNLGHRCQGRISFEFDYTDMDLRQLRFAYGKPDSGYCEVNVFTNDGDEMDAFLKQIESERQSISTQDRN